MAMIEVARATVTIVPNMAGSQQTITEGLTGAASTAGTKAGTAAGKNISNSIGKSLSSAGKTMTKGITVPLTAAATASVAAWKDVDSAMDTVASKTGATGKNLDSLTDSMKKVATSLPTDFQTAGDAVGEVNTKFQLTGEQLEELSGQFVKFAALNETDVSSSVDTVANTLAAFGEDASHASSVLDAMNAAGQATGIGMDELGNALQKNAATFTELGLSVEDAAGMMATFNAAGLTTSDTSTALRTALKNAAKDGQTLEEAIAQFSKTMGSSASNTDKLNAAIDLFGSRAGTTIYNAFNNGTISAQDFSAAMTDVSGNVSTTFESTLDPADRLTQVMNELKLTGAGLVEAAAPLISTIADLAIPAVQNLSDAFTGLPPGMQTAIVAIAGVVAAAGPLVSVGGKVIGGISKIGGGFTGLSGNLLSFGGAAATAGASSATAATGFSTMAGAALQLVAIGASFVMVGEGIKLIADAAVKIAEGGLPAAAAMLEMVAAISALMGVAAALGPALTAGAAGIAAFGAAALGIGAGIDLACTGIAKLNESFGTVLKAANDSKDGITQITETISGGFVDTIDAVGRVIHGALDGVSDIIKSIGTASVDCGRGMSLMADGVKKIVDLKLTDLALSMGAVAKGIKEMSQYSSEINLTSTALSTFTVRLTAAGAKFNDFQTAVTTAMTASTNTVKLNLQEMQKAFATTTFKFNNIEIPHFKMNGSFDAEAGTVPTVSVEWYAQAAEKGAIFSSPQIIGVGDASQPELLIGEDTLYKNIREASESVPGDVYVYIGDEQLDAIIRRSQKRMALRSGGR